MSMDIILKVLEHEKNNVMNIFGPSAVFYANKKVSSYNLHLFHQLVFLSYCLFLPPAMY